MKARYAPVVITKPGGTGNPTCSRRRRFAPLPPSVASGGSSASAASSASSGLSSQRIHDEVLIAAPFALHATDGLRLLLQLASRLSSVRLEPAQKDCDNCLDIHIVCESRSLQRGEEEFATELRECHADKGARAGPYIVWPESAQLNLVREIGLDEAQHSANHPAPQQIGDLGAPQRLRREETYEPQRGRALSHLQVGAREQGQNLVGRLVEQRGGIADDLRDR